MTALSRFATRLVGRARFERPPHAEPEPINAVPRPLVGLFAQLTSEQKKAALAYRGPEAHGEPAFRLKRVQEHA